MLSKQNSMQINQLTKLSVVFRQSMIKIYQSQFVSTNATFFILSVIYVRNVKVKVPGSFRKVPKLSGIYGSGGNFAQH